MTLDAYPVRLTHLWRWRNDRVILFSDATFNIRRFDLNLLAGTIWELSDGQRTVGDIVGIIANAFPTQPVEPLQAGVMTFLDDLEKEWLVMGRDALDGDD